MCLYSSVVERQSCKLEVRSSILRGGIRFLTGVFILFFSFCDRQRSAHSTLNWPDDMRKAMRYFAFDSTRQRGSNANDMSNVPMCSCLGKLHERRSDKLNHSIENIDQPVNSVGPLLVERLDERDQTHRSIIETERRDEQLSKSMAVDRGEATGENVVDEQCAFDDERDTSGHVQRQRARLT
jgi:hypothetical protein